MQRPRPCLLVSALAGDDDLALLGELDRVDEQVEQDLADPAEVAEHSRRAVADHLVRELDALARGRRRDHVERALDRSRPG